MSRSRPRSNRCRRGSRNRNSRCAMVMSGAGIPPRLRIRAQAKMWARVRRGSMVEIRREGGDEIARVLEFWLDEVGPEGWYAVDEAVDRRIAEEFGELMEEARHGRLIHWRATPLGALALLILLDQFPRNVSRGRPEAHRADARARAVAKASIACGLDLRVEGPGRQFFYLPLMHSESLPDQDRCVRLMVMRAPDPDGLHHATMHRGVIRSFGRFPSRNTVLGRIDTKAEIAYRAEGGYMSAPGVFESDAAN